MRATRGPSGLRPRRLAWGLCLCAALASPASAATLTWNVPGGTPGANGYVLVDSVQVTLELIAELGPDEPLVPFASVTAEKLPGVFIQFDGEPSQVPLTTTVDSTTVFPWTTFNLSCGSQECLIVDQVNPRPSEPAPVDPFSGVIATIDVTVFEGGVVARGGDFFGAEDAVVRLLLIPEPTSAGLLAAGLSALALARRRRPQK